MHWSCHTYAAATSISEQIFDRRDFFGVSNRYVKRSEHARFGIVWPYAVRFGSMHSVSAFQPVCRKGVLPTDPVGNVSFGLIEPLQRRAKSLSTTLGIVVFIFFLEICRVESLIVARNQLASCIHAFLRLLRSGYP